MRLGTVTRYGAGGRRRSLRVNERACVRDDVTECNCASCSAGDERWWAEQNGTPNDARDHDFEDEEPTKSAPNITMAETVEGR